MRQGTLMVVTAVALGGCAGVVRDRIYRPSPAIAQTPPWPAAAPQAMAVTTADGLTLTGFYWAPRDGRTDVTVYFHGNGFNQQVGALRAAPLAAGGHGVLVASYRGYGGNPGRPSERGLIADGEAWMRKAAELQPSGKRYVFGHSLGGAVALAMAGRLPVDGVVTLGAFSRLADVAPPVARPFLPDRFDNLAAIARVRAPVFLFHGDTDTTVAYANAARLAAASGGRATVVTLAGAGHQVPLQTIAPAIWSALETGRPPAPVSPPGRP